MDNWDTVTGEPRAGRWFVRIVRPIHIGLLALVVLAASAVVALSPALGAGATIRIGSPQLSPGESATVTLEGVSFAEPGLGAITVDVRYDPMAVAVTACKADPEGVFDLALCNQEFAAHTVRVTAVHVQGKVGDFALAEITIEALGEAVDPMLDVTVATLADPAGAGFEAVIEDSGVSESAEPPGSLSEESEAASTASEGEEPAGSLPDGESESAELPVDAESESAEPPVDAESEAAESVTSPSADSKPADSRGHPLLQTDQPWLYLVVATLSLGVAVVGLVLIRRRRRA